MVQTESIFEVTADPGEIKLRLNTRQLCFVLNANLKVSHITKILDKYYLMAVKHNGNIRHAAVCGLYKEAPKDFEKLTVETASADMWRDGGDNPVLDILITDPLCILLSTALTPLQVKMVERVYETLELFYMGQTRKAIACAYHDPSIPLKGQVLSIERRII